MPRRYLNIKSSAKRLTFPVLLISAFYGVVQDLLLPLSAIGFWTGLVFLGVAFCIAVIPVHSSLSRKLKELTEHWKFPLVVANLLIGIGVIAFSTLSLANKDHGGYLAKNFETGKVIQSQLGIIQQQTLVIQSDLLSAEVDLSIAEATLEQVLQQLQQSSSSVLQDLGLNLSDRYSIFQMLLNNHGEDLALRATLLKDTGFSISQTVPVFGNMQWENSHMGLRATRMPRFLPFSHHLILGGIGEESLEILLDIFGVQIFSVDSNVSSGYAVNDYPRPSLYSHDPNGFNHPLKLIDDLHFPTPYSYSLVSYFRTEGSDERGSYSLLHTAAVANNPHVVNLLKERGLDPRAKTHSGYTALALALEHHSWSFIEVLLALDESLTEDSFAVKVAQLKALSYVLEPDEHTFYQLSSPLTKNGNPYLRFLKRVKEQNTHSVIFDSDSVKVEFERAISSPLLSPQVKRNIVKIKKILF